MAHLIDKDALVADIEKTINEPYPKHDQQCDWEDGYCSGLSKALSIIEDTLEVKEAGISITNIDDILKKEGLDPDSKEAKMFKQSYYKAIDLYLTKVQKED